MTAVPTTSVPCVPSPRRLHSPRRRSPRGCLLAALLVLAVPALPVLAPEPVRAAVLSTPAGAPASGGSSGGTSLEAAASRAGDTGRKVAMSLIGLALAVAAVVLAFRRDFKEAAGVLAVGVVAILLASPAGVNVIRDTVGSIFGTG